MNAALLQFLECVLDAHGAGENSLACRAQLMANCP